MSDQPEHPETPGHEPVPTARHDDLPAGFFDDEGGRPPEPADRPPSPDPASPEFFDLPEPEHRHDAPAPPEHSFTPTTPRASEPDRSTFEEAAPVTPVSAPVKTPTSTPTPTTTAETAPVVADRARTSNPPASAATPVPASRPSVALPAFLSALLGSLAGAGAVWYALGRRAEAPPEPDKSPAAATAPAATPDDVKAMTTRLDDLAGQVKTLQGRVNAPAMPVEPGLKAVQEKLGELSKTVAAVAPLPEVVAKLDGRLNASDEAIKAAHAQLAKVQQTALKAEAGTETTKTETTAPAPAPAPAVPTLEQGAEMFKAARYGDALAAFNKIEAAGSTDARVYYYSALARGVSANEWTGPTVTAVKRGVELEKAGTPAAAEIDATFADLPPRIKPWLDGYRKFAR